MTSPSENLLERIVQLEVALERRERTIRKLQRSRQHVRELACNLGEKSIARQREIGRLERKLIAVYKIASEKRALSAIADDAKDRLVARIVEEAIPTQLGRWKARRGLA